MPIVWMALTAALAVAPSSSASSSSQPPTCPPDEETMSGARHLRAISLDLRGVVPSPDEYERLVGGEVPESLVDEWLDSEAFADRAVRFHRSLLWNNVDDQRLVSTNSMFTTTDGIHWLRNRADDYRNDGNLYCGDFEATLGPDGVPEAVDQGDGTVQEGWVEVVPWWSDSEPIKVCAFDAQTVAVSPDGVACDGVAAASDPGCGCGPDLRWCSVYYAEDTITEAMSTDIDLRVRQLVLDDRPYLELLTGQVGFVNGPLVHYYRHLARQPATVRFEPSPVVAEELPDLDPTSYDFVPVALPEGHSGVLTAPGFLLRFQTNRARANQFFNAFLCQPFQPPDNGIEIDPNEAQTVDLTVRPGCDYCHALLEPAAAHWGRWIEQGGGYLDPADYPSFDPLCYDCSVNSNDCPDVCSRYYVTDPLSSEYDPYVGWLNAHAFLEPWQDPNVDAGPAGLVNASVVDGRLQECTARNAATWLLGRALHEGDDAQLDDWAATLVGSGWSYKELVKAIVMSDSYRRLP
jgi:hypothetical protein